MKKVGILICALMVLATAAPSTEKMTKIPGYPDDFNTSIYTGYLDVKSPDRAIHYVFVESINGPDNKDPVTVWLNGGPGCSSLIGISIITEGFLQQIGPYYLEEGVNYKEGDKLTKNKYSWHRVSNLLFLESPAGVGYSYNTNTSMPYTDGITAVDNLNAILDFFEKFSEHRSHKFWLAGESYAGKYIPQLAVAIDHYNAFDAPDGKKIDMRGILVGNGVMQYSTTANHQIQFLLSHSFINPDIQSYWSISCQFDPLSAGCGFFTINVKEDFDEVNPYNVYGYCYYNDSFGEQKKKKLLSQESILMGIQGRHSNSAFKESKFNGAPCSYFDGMLSYFNLHQKQFRAKWDQQHWNGPCAENITYMIDPQGSMQDYRKLLGQVVQKGYTIHLYNGNWDVVVPSGDTIDNIKKLDLVQSYLYTPWFIEDENGKEQHAGFTQIYSGIIFTIVKGASHMVPQSKRAEALQLFNSTLAGHADGLGKGKSSDQKEVLCILIIVKKR